MKKVSIPISCFLCIELVEGQKPTRKQVDSLYQLLVAGLSGEDEIDAHMHIGKYFLMMNTDSSIYHSTKAMELAREVGGKEKEARAITNIGIGHSIKSEFAEAMEYLVQAQAYYDIHPDPQMMAIIYNEYAVIHLYQKQMREAIPMLLTSMQYKNEIGDSVSIAKSYNNLAGIYEQLGKLDSSLFFHNKSLEIKERLGYQHGVAYSKSNISSVLHKQGKFEEAMKSAQESLAIFETVEDRDGKIYALHMVSECYRDIKDYPNALKYRKATLKEAEALGVLRRIQDSHKHMAAIYEEMGDYQQALFHERLFRSYKDSVDNDRNVRKIEQVKAQYEIDKRESEIAEQDAVLAKQANERNALVAGFVLLIIVIALVVRNARLKSRSLSEKESLLREIHHRVKNNLQVISSLLNMQSREADDPQMLDVIKEGQSRVKAMSLIHQKLYQTSNLSEIDFEEYSTQLIDQLAALYKKKGLEVTKQITAKNIKLDIDTAIPLGLILNELISNCFKYAFEDLEKGEIQVSLERLSKEDLKLVVSDSGAGLPSHIDVTSIKSLGLKLVNILTKQLKGSLNFSSDHGARFEIQFKDLKLST